MSGAVDARVPLTDLTPSRQQVLNEALQGLNATPRRLPSKYFYDATGSALFEQITRTPEYYPTRVELGLLAACLPEIAARIGGQAHVVELGSGSGRKTALLLQALQAPVAYTPIEISRAALLASIEHLASVVPAVEMLPVCADFTRPVTLPQPAQVPARRLLFFPGSTLGNFEEGEAIALLQAMRTTMGADGLALVGIDLDKDSTTLEAAYNDAAGITAAFTVNLLRRLNREIGSDFDLEAFHHRARYDRARLRIDTQLVSTRPQDVHVGGQRFHFDAGDSIQVEYSHKYTDASFQALLDAAGLRLVSRWDATMADHPGFGLRLLQAR